jgi:hypothetical protein
MNIEKPYLSNDFSAPGVDRADADSLGSAFFNFMTETHAIGWRLVVETRGRNGWTATVTAPDGVRTLHQIPDPSPLNPVERLRLRLAEQWKECSKRHARTAALA